MSQRAVDLFVRRKLETYGESRYSMICPLAKVLVLLFYPVRSLRGYVVVYPIAVLICMLITIDSTVDCATVLLTIGFR